MITLLILQVILLLCLAYLLNCISQRLEELNQRAWAEASKSLQEKPKRIKGKNTHAKDKNLPKEEISRNFDVTVGDGGGVIIMPKSLDKKMQLVQENQREGIPTRLKDLLDDGDDTDQI